MSKGKKCNCAGKCFAKIDGICTILKETPKEKCSFQKPKRDVTNGIKYEFRKVS